MADNAHLPLPCCRCPGCGRLLAPSLSVDARKKQKKKKKKKKKKPRGRAHIGMRENAGQVETKEQMGNLKKLFS
jgi:hypothetical protein